MLEIPVKQGLSPYGWGKIEWPLKTLDPFFAILEMSSEFLFVGYMVLKLEKQNANSDKRPFEWHPYLLLKKLRAREGFN